jgi:hypothetical protein
MPSTSIITKFFSGGGARLLMLVTGRALKLAFQPSQILGRLHKPLWLCASGANSNPKKQTQFKTPFLPKSFLKTLHFPLFSLIFRLCIFRTYVARNTKISPEQTQSNTALKYQLINNLRNMCGIFWFKNEPNFSASQGGLAKEKYFPSPATGLKLQQIDLDKTKLENILHRHKLKLPKL